MADREAWQAARSRERALVETATPILDQVRAMASRTDCAVLLTDWRGMLLDVRGGVSDIWSREPAAWLGTVYSEERLGTTGIGMCIADQRAVVVRGEQNFLTCLADRVWIAVPLFGAEGRLVGSLAVHQAAGVLDEQLDPLLTATLATFARRIETELFARAHPQTRLVLASSQGRMPEALLAVDHDDRVVGATRAARRLLSLSDDALAEAPNVDDLVSAGAAARGDVLVEAERRTIVRALSRAGGNLSAAARLVGISRSTLYRKLAAYEIGTAMGAAKPRPSA